MANPSKGFFSKEKVNIRTNFPTMLDQFEEFFKRDPFFTSETFPKKNIISNGSEVIIELALAGYKKEDITVIVDKTGMRDMLVIKTSDGFDPNINTADVGYSDNEWTYQHHGLKHSAFTQEYELGRNLIVHSVKYTDGILRIHLKSKEELPRTVETIDIT